MNVCVSFSDTGEATLRIIGVASDDDGVYTCVATNELGSVTSSASLRVLGESTDTVLPSRCGDVAATYRRELMDCVVCLSCVHWRDQSELEGQLWGSLHWSGWTGKVKSTVSSSKGFVKDFSLWQ